MMRTVIFAAAAAGALAACPNSCSGHGKCGESDKCKCFTQQGTYSPYRAAWTGADCSQRTCPVGPAFGAISNGRPEIKDFTFRSASGVSQPKLTAVFVPTSQDDTCRAARSDKSFVVQIMSHSSTTYPYGTFAWRGADEEFFQPEQPIAAYMDATSGYSLATATSGNCGVYVYWDARKEDTASFATDASQIAVGDSYSFTLTFNDGLTYDAGNSNTAHQNVECSGQGKCDGSTGKCKCNPGYTGDACQRTVCPNGCSGHGTCQTQWRMAADGSSANTLAYKGAADKEQQYGCKCDSGYRGADCSMIECASGPDPMGALGGAEGMDCSGRGTCNYGTGQCNCFKGFFGNRCESQSNLV